MLVNYTLQKATATATATATTTATTSSEENSFSIYWRRASYEKE
jgi:hypothetical protein